MPRRATGRPSRVRRKARRAAGSRASAREAGAFAFEVQGSAADGVTKDLLRNTCVLLSRSLGVPEAEARAYYDARGPFKNKKPMETEVWKLRRYVHMAEQQEELAAKLRAAMPLAGAREDDDDETLRAALGAAAPSLSTADGRAILGALHNVEIIDDLLPTHRVRLLFSLKAVALGEIGAALAAREPRGEPTDVYELLSLIRHGPFSWSDLSTRATMDTTLVLCALYLGAVLAAKGVAAKDFAIPHGTLSWFWGKCLGRSEVVEPLCGAPIPAHVQMVLDALRNPHEELRGATAAQYAAEELGLETGLGVSSAEIVGATSNACISAIDQAQA